MDELALLDIRARMSIQSRTRQLTQRSEFRVIQGERRLSRADYRSHSWCKENGLSGMNIEITKDVVGEKG